jgi:hypothetical protein
MNEIDLEKAKDRLKNYEAKKREFSVKASETSRSLAFAQIALFWMFLMEFKYHEIYVYIGLVTLVLYFFFDVGQYLSGLFSYKYLCKKARNSIKQEQYSEKDINNKGANTLPNMFFWIKVALLIISSVFLGISFYKSYYLIQASLL